MTTLPANARLQCREYVKLSDGTTQADITTDGELKTISSVKIVDTDDNPQGVGVFRGYIVTN